MKEYDDKYVPKKLIFKNKKNRNKSKDFLLSFNIINLSNDPSLKDISLKPLKKINHDYTNLVSTPSKINQGTNTMSSILKKSNKNKNRRNLIKFNSKKKLFNEIEKQNYVDDFNSSTIRSNGKFQNSINDNKELKIINNNSDKKFLIRQNIKKFILKSSNSKNNIKETFDQNKKIILGKKSTNKNKLNESWKGLNISSHYLGNTPNNRFGITSNKFFINKNFTLTNSKESMRYTNNSLNSSKIRKNNLKFITLNIPNHSNYFNDMSSTNLFTRLKCIINNEQLYKKLMNQMTTVFIKRIKNYSSFKSYHKNHISSFNEMNYSKEMFNMKQYKIFNDNKLEISKMNKNHIPFIERNDIFPKINKANLNTYDINNKFIKINIKNSNNKKCNENKIESTTDNIISVNKNK